MNSGATPALFNQQIPASGRPPELSILLVLGALSLFVATSAEEPLIATPVKENADSGKWLPRLFQRKPREAESSDRTTKQPKRYQAVPVEPSETGQSNYSNSPPTLEDLIGEALVNNSQLNSVRQDEIIQLAQSEFTRKDAFPLLAIYGGHYNQPPGQGSSPSQRAERNAYGITAEQPLLDWGQSRGTVEAERHQARAHYWNSKVKELDTIYQVTEVYWRLVFFQNVIELRKSALAARRRQKDSVADRVAARESRRADLLLIESEIAEAEQELMKAENGLSLAMAQLMFYLGRDSERALEIDDQLTLCTSPGAPAGKLTGHPEIEKVKAAQMAAGTTEKAARAGFLPKVILRGQIEDSSASNSPGASNFVPDGTNYQIGAYVSLPVGRQRAAAKAKLNEAYARQVQLAADAESLKKSLRLRIRQAEIQLEEALKSVTVSESKKLAAIENLKLRKDLAMINNATRADVARAKSLCLEAEIGYLKSLYDVKEAEAHYVRELGLQHSR